MYNVFLTAFLRTLGIMVQATCCDEYCWDIFNVRSRFGAGSLFIQLGLGSDSTWCRLTHRINFTDCVLREGNPAVAPGYTRDCGLVLRLITTEILANLLGLIINFLVLGLPCMTWRSSLRCCD